jgi:deoxyribonuclease V
MVLACCDVDYRPRLAVAACVLAADWGDAAPFAEAVARVADPAPYRPGRFFERELPPLLAVLAGLRPDVVIVDGHVWLGAGVPGLGAHLHAALGGAVAVVGVAKQAFHGPVLAIPVLRGASRSPLHVTAVGLDPAEAAARVAAMHGDHRLPTLLKRADRLAREA